MPFTARETFWNDNLLPNKPLTLAKACERAETHTYQKSILASTTGQALYCEYPHRTNINMSDIYTRLIQVTGRFAENYASDLVYEIDTIRDLLSALPEDKDFNGKDRLDYYLASGIRDCGVDGNSFVMSRLQQTAAASFGHYANPRAVYRKLLCVHITFEKKGVSAKLVDITDYINNIDPEDKTDAK